MKKDTRPYEQPEMPHDTDTERAVLATLMRYNEKAAEVSDLLSPDIFYYPRERAIYHAIAGLMEEGKITDINALYDWTRRNGTEANLEKTDFIETMQLQSVPTLTQDIMRLRTMARQRLGWTLLQQAANNILDPMGDIDETVNGAMTALSEMQAATAGDGIASFKDAIDELTEMVEANRNGGHTALMTGFYIFDNFYLLRPGTLTIIAAFTSVGKSALAMNIAVAVAKAGTATAYYSLEMGKAELASRAVSKMAGTPASIIMNKKLIDSQLADFYAAAREYGKLPIYIDERSTVSFDRTVRSIRTMAKTKDVKLVIIDYLQIYTQTSENVEASLGQMARQAKNIAKETGTAVIMLSQLNRSGSHPSINMLRGSGQIEESADNIVLIDRPEAYPDNKVTKYEGEFSKVSVEGTAKLMLVKGRGVGTGCCIVNFDGTHTTFIDQYHPEGPIPEEEQPAEEQLPF